MRVNGLASRIPVPNSALVHRFVVLEFGERSACFGCRSAPSDVAVDVRRRFDPPEDRLRPEGAPEKNP